MLCFKVNNLKLKNVNNLVKKTFFLQSITQSQSIILCIIKEVYIFMFLDLRWNKIFPSKINNRYVNILVLNKASL